MLAAMLAALARLLRLLARLLLSTALLLLAGLLATALLLAPLAGSRIVLLLLVRILIGIIHKDGSLRVDACLRVDVLSHPPTINLQA